MYPNNTHKEAQTVGLRVPFQALSVLQKRSHV